MPHTSRPDDLYLGFWCVLAAQHLAKRLGKYGKFVERSYRKRFGRTVSLRDGGPKRANPQLRARVGLEWPWAGVLPTLHSHERRTCLKIRKRSSGKCGSKYLPHLPKRLQAPQITYAVPPCRPLSCEASRADDMRGAGQSSNNGVWPIRGLPAARTSATVGRRRPGQR